VQTVKPFQDQNVKVKVKVASLYLLRRIITSFPMCWLGLIVTPKSHQSD